MAKKILTDMLHYPDVRRGPFACILEKPPSGFTVRDDLEMPGSFERGISGIQSSPWLAEQRPRSVGESVDRYAPLGMKGLLDGFIAISGQDDVLAYANAYGWLGEPFEAEDVDETVTVEAIAFWITQGQQLKRDRALLDLVRHQKHGALENLVRWSWSDARPGSSPRAMVAIAVISDRGVPNLDLSRRLLLGTELIDMSVEGRSKLNEQYGISKGREAVERWNPGDVVAPVLHDLICRANDMLEGHMTPKVLPAGEGGIVIELDSLLASLWAIHALDLASSEAQTGERKCRLSDCMVTFRPVGRQVYCSSEHADEGKRRRQRDEWAKKGDQYNTGRRGAYAKGKAS